MSIEYWFIGDDGRKWLVRCPECGKENYALAVKDGVCAWCGYEANKDGEDEVENER